jgi:hypothetical protein
MKYFRVEEDSKATLPKNFISGFLEVRLSTRDIKVKTDNQFRDEIRYTFSQFDTHFSMTQNSSAMQHDLW